MAAPAPISSSTASSEFVAVEGGGDSGNAGTFLVAAYILMWLLLMLFVWMTFKKQRALRERISLLESAVAKHTHSSDDA